MVSRRAAIQTASVAFIGLLVVSAIVAGYLAVTTSKPTAINSTSSSYGTSSSAANQIYTAGPISTWPASWTNPCRLPVHGNLTTNNEILSSFAPGVANFSLSQVYSKIVNSSAFRNVSAGLSWVTTYWGLQQVSGPNGSYEYVVATFVLVSEGKPAGYVQANYNLQTGEVTADFQSGLVSSCPARISSSTGTALDKPSPAYYATGETVKITFSVIDDTVANMLVASPSSCLGNFTILQGIGTTGPVVYDSTKHGGCRGTPLSVILNPGQSYNQTLTWNQTDDAGAQVQPGSYEAMGIVAGSSQTYLSPIGEVYVGVPLLPVNSAILRQQFYYQGNLGNDFMSPGQPVKIVWVLSNSGQQAYELETSACSYSYKVLDLKGSVIFDFANHASCANQLQDNPAPPMGGISHVSYWNQTKTSGATVSPGFYRVLVDLHVWSGGHEFNMTADSDLEITSSNIPLSGEQISVASSSICAANCGSNASPYLYSSVYANGNLTSLQLYLNGTLVGAMSYKLHCCQLSYQVSFNTPIDTHNIPIVPGISYDLVLISTFQDGGTSISWANPLNR